MSEIEKARCGYCQGSEPIVSDNDGLGIVIDVFTDGDMQIDSLTSMPKYVKINYCPMCGRRLTQNDAE